MTKGKNSSIQALRGIGFLLVFLYHAEVIPAGGIMGVELFFVMSGFLLSIIHPDQEIPLRLKDCAEYSVKKMRKLYLLHLLMAFCALPFLVYRFWGKSHAIASIVLRTMANVLLIQAWIPVDDVKYSLNNLSWFLSCMLFLYFIFPFVKARMRKINDERTVLTRMAAMCVLISAISIVLWYVCACRCGDINLFKMLTYNFPAFRALDFILGCYLGKFVSMHPFSIEKYKATVLEILALILVAAIALIDWNGMFDVKYWVGCNILPILPAVCIIILFYQRKGIISDSLGKGIMKSLGDISGQTYLIHEIVLIYLGYALNYALKNINSTWITVIRALLGFAITMMLAKAWNYVGKRLEKQHE